MYYPDRNEELYNKLQPVICILLNCRHSLDVRCYAIIVGIPYSVAREELAEGISFEASYKGSIRLKNRYIDSDIRDYIDRLIAEHLF